MTMTSESRSYQLCMIELNSDNEVKPSIVCVYPDEKLHI